jgi:hypothetical protein
VGAGHAPVSSIDEGLQSHLWKHSDPLVSFDGMTRFLCDLIASFGSNDQIVIVIDRLDQWGWSDQADSEANALH